ncbi:collagen alpha-1(I) chain-like isoform X1 [Canis lupus dingo]|uniref:collagen alpha-1(I) chain-like isoform X1 n=1 Tax=Canis lupus dingo TaxID=286419 RepID=UPI000DC695EE|nr:collagen alpha-1(I) chain-like isoform X1 [Canis lupus dingo]XP_048961546.1 collagen alpha-1(I) chain-like isoform X1 [Canis lupus dingo]
MPCPDVRSPPRARRQLRRPGESGPPALGVSGRGQLGGGRGPLWARPPSDLALSCGDPPPPQGRRPEGHGQREGTELRPLAAWLGPGWASAPAAPRRQALRPLPGPASGLQGRPSEPGGLVTAAAARRAHSWAWAQRSGAGAGGGSCLLTSPPGGSDALGFGAAGAPTPGGKREQQGQEERSPGRADMGREELRGLEAAGPPRPPVLRSGSWARGSRDYGDSKSGTRRQVS